MRRLLPRVALLFDRQGKYFDQFRFGQIRVKLIEIVNADRLPDGVQKLPRLGQVVTKLLDAPTITISFEGAGAESLSLEQADSVLSTFCNPRKE